MRDLWRWWKLRSPQRSGVVLLGLILAWMSLSLYQVEQHYRAVVLEVRQSFQKQEENRQAQFARLLQAVDAHLSRQDVNEKAHRQADLELRLMLGQVIEQTRKPVVP